MKALCSELARSMLADRLGQASLRRYLADKRAAGATLSYRATDGRTVYVIASVVSKAG